MAGFTSRDGRSLSHSSSFCTRCSSSDIARASSAEECSGPSSGRCMLVVARGLQWLPNAVMVSLSRFVVAKKTLLGCIAHCHVPIAHCLWRFMDVNESKSAFPLLDSQHPILSKRRHVSKTSPTLAAISPTHLRFALTPPSFFRPFRPVHPYCRGIIHPTPVSHVQRCLAHWLPILATPCLCLILYRPSSSSPIHRST